MSFIPVPNIERIVAHSKPVKGDIRARGGEMLAAAKVVREAHRDQGHVFIEGNMGRTDYSVFLDDTRGKSAAFSIEFGTRGRVVVGKDGELYMTRGTRPTRMITGPHMSAAAGGESRG